MVQNPSNAILTADSNDNITKIAEHVTATGGLLVTDTATGSADNSFAEMYLNAGQLFFKYTDTASTTLSGGSDFTSLSGTAL